MPFPNTPFTFEQDDSDLLKYLIGGIANGTFGYLKDSKDRIIAELDPKKDLATQKKDALKNLWPVLLTDALRELKRCDTREYKRGGKIDFDSFFNRESLGIHELENVLGAFDEFESLMYGAQPDQYRDHIAHTFRVWIIGHGLLHSWAGSTLVFDGYSEADEKKDWLKQLRLSPGEWDCAWAIAALCHDIGYPLTAVGDINDKAKRSLEKQGLRSVGDLRFSFSPHVVALQDTFLRLMASKIVPSSLGDRGYLTHLQNKYYLKLLHSFDKLQHGVISALLMASALVYFLESDYTHDPRESLKLEDAQQSLIRREILRAVASHTSPDIYHLRFNTLSFLLFIIDELQGWGRPTFEQYREGQPFAKTDVAVTISKFEETAIEISVEVRSAWAEREEKIGKQLAKIARRLRLAVGAEKYADLELSFDVHSAGGKDRCALGLKGGRITREGFS